MAIATATPATDRTSDRPSLVSRGAFDQHIATTIAQVKTASAMTVDVARKTNAGVISVATTSIAASAGGTPRWRVKSNQQAMPAASIARTEINFSQIKLSGNDGLIRKTAERIAGNPGGTAGRIWRRGRADQPKSITLRQCLRKDDVPRIVDHQAGDVIEAQQVDGDDACRRERATAARRRVRTRA